MFEFWYNLIESFRYFWKYRYISKSMADLEIEQETNVSHKK